MKNVVSIFFMLIISIITPKSLPNVRSSVRKFIKDIFFDTTPVKTLLILFFCIVWYFKKDIAIPVNFFIGGSITGILFGILISTRDTITTGYTKSYTVPDYVYMIFSIIITGFFFFFLYEKSVLHGSTTNRVFTAILFYSIVEISLFGGKKILQTKNNNTLFFSGENNRLARHLK